MDLRSEHTESFVSRNILQYLSYRTSLVAPKRLLASLHQDLGPGRQRGAEWRDFHVSRQCSVLRRSRQDESDLFQSGLHSTVRLTMNFKRLAFKSIPHVAFVAAAAVILMFGWVLYGTSVRATESTRWVNHTLDVIKAFHDVDEQISLAESAQRGYLLTTAETFLEERDQALAAASVAVIAIKELTIDNKDQQRRVSRLEKLNAQRISIMRENERRLQTEGTESVRTRIASGVGRAATKAIDLKS